MFLRLIFFFEYIDWPIDFVLRKITERRRFALLIGRYVPSSLKIFFSFSKHCDRLLLLIEFLPRPCIYSEDFFLSRAGVFYKHPGIKHKLKMETTGQVQGPSPGKEELLTVMQVGLEWGDQHCWQDVRCVGRHRVSRSQQHTLVAKRNNNILGCVTRRDGAK